MQDLDYEKFADYLSRHYSSDASRQARLVGSARQHDSGYAVIRRFFGPESIDPEETFIRYLPGSFVVTDPVVVAFSKEVAAQLATAGRLYDGPPATAIVEEELESEAPFVTIQACDYGLFAGCCFALDRPDQRFGPEWETLREYTHGKPNLLPGCIGVCGLLRTADNSLLIVTRAGHLASLENAEGPSAAGSVDYGEHYGRLSDLIFTSMHDEISEELHLDSGEYDVVPLAYAHELFRGGKPQVFCLIETTLHKDAVRSRLDSVTQPKEFDSYRFIRLDRRYRASVEDLDGLNHEALMNYFLLEEFVAVESAQ